MNDRKIYSARQKMRDLNDEAAAIINEHLDAEGVTEFVARRVGDELRIMRAPLPPIAETDSRVNSRDAREGGE